MVNWIMEAIGAESVCSTQNQRGMNPLHLCCTFKGTGELVSKMLVHYGMSVNESTSSGETALDLALKRGDRDITSLLARYGGRKNFMSCLDEGDVGSVRCYLDEDGVTKDTWPPG